MNTNTWTVYYHRGKAHDPKAGWGWTFVPADTREAAWAEARKRFGARAYNVVLWAANGPIAN